MEGRSSPAASAVRWAPSSAMPPAPPRLKGALRLPPRCGGRAGGAPPSSLTPLWWRGAAALGGGSFSSRSSRVLPAVPFASGSGSATAPAPQRCVRPFVRPSVSGAGTWGGSVGRGWRGYWEELGGAGEALGRGLGRGWEALVRYWEGM